MPRLTQGRIVWATVPDPQGRNPKDRPLVIMSKNAEALAADVDILAVGITTQFQEAPANIQVALPWSRANSAGTQLTEPSFAVCTWVHRIKKSEIRKTGGIVPPAALLQIQKIIAGLVGS